MICKSQPGLMMCCFRNWGWPKVLPVRNVSPGWSRRTGVRGLFAVQVDEDAPWCKNPDHFVNLLAAGSDDVLGRVLGAEKSVGFPVSYPKDGLFTQTSLTPVMSASMVPLSIATSKVPFSKGRLRTFPTSPESGRCCQ